MRFWNVYRIVFRKELRELLRDRRSLFWLFAPPIILPGLGICAALFIGSQAVRIAQDGFPIVIENPEQAPELVQRFEEAETIRVVEPDASSSDPYGDAVVIVSIPEDFQQQLKENGTANIQLITRDSSFVTLFGRTAVSNVINGYSEELLDQRLAEQGLTREWLKPISIGERRQRVTAVAGTSGEGEQEEEEGGNILATIFLPLAVTSWLLGGGMGLILDTTVGEKERQTIENLLVTPASRMGIVMGKMTVVFIASMLVMTVWLSEGLLLNAVSEAGPELAQQDNLSTREALRTLSESGGNIFGLVGALVLMIVPFTIMLNALVMSWCAYASNYREANLVMALIQLGLPASVLMTIFSFPSDVADWMYAIPFLGTIVAIRDLFSNALPVQGLSINIISGVIYAFAAISLAAWMFEREWSLTRGLQ